MLRQFKHRVNLKCLLRLRLSLLLAALLSLAYTLPAQNWIQWPASAGGNDHYYALTPFATNWEAAESLAESWGGTLATINSSNEQDFINRTFLNGPLEHRPVWIGLMNSPVRRPFRLKLGPVKIEIGSEQNGDFKWVTGEPLNYTNWKPGEPSNNPPGEHHVAINWEYSDDPPRGVKGDWNDTPENGTTGYGGTTSGPYFGIVERDYDPRLPVRPRPINYSRTFHLTLLITLPIILLAVFLRFHRKKKPAA